MQLSLTEIVAITSGRMLGQDRPVTGLSIDTRTLQPGDLFVAIEGEHFDGHTFADQAEQLGALALMLQRPLPIDLPQIIVSDTRLALAQVAAAWRQRIPLQVVGVTGSNGKTTVKEMIAAILSVAGNVLYTQSNFNNDIGVPLTLLRLLPEHRYAVIEMGANHPGEIRYTSRLVDADVVVITNAGPAHLEGFGDVRGVAKAKGEIIETLSEQSAVVLRQDDAFYDYWRELAGSRQCVSFGMQGEVRANNILFSCLPQGFMTRFDLEVGDQTILVELPLAGEHNVINALAAAAACLQLGTPLSQIKAGLASVQSVKGRLQAKRTAQGSLIIDDSYNANPGSLQAALQVLMQCPGETWLVLGAFGELGEHSIKLHREMGALCKQYNVSRLFATGPDAQYCVEAFAERGNFFSDQTQMIAVLKQQMTGKETVLVKGSRAQKMEKVVNALAEQVED